jgi:hypothetical protein
LGLATPRLSQTKLPTTADNPAALKDFNYGKLGQATIFQTNDHHGAHKRIQPY